MINFLPVTIHFIFEVENKINLNFSDALSESDDMSTNTTEYYDENDQSRQTVRQVGRHGAVRGKKIYETRGHQFTPHYLKQPTFCSHCTGLVKNLN